MPPRGDASRWPELAGCLQRCFIAHDQAPWAARFEALVACVHPVLSLTESRAHALHQTAWADGRPATVPRFTAPFIPIQQPGDTP